MKDSARLGIETLIQHFAEEDLPYGAVTPPIVQSSLFTFESVDEWRRAMQEDTAGPPFHYSRVGNPTNDILERKLAWLDGADRCKVFASGMAAISASLFSCLEAGGHVVAIDSCYGPTRMLLTEVLARFGVATSFVDGRDPQTIFDACRDDTQVVYLESPSSVLFRLQDLAAIATECRARGIVTIIDNSYCTPLLQRPLDFGIDIAVQTASKYLGGHSDITAGVVCMGQSRFETFLRKEFSLLGGALGPFQAWLMLRGLRTLPLRLRRHGETANVVANWLAERREVLRVHHVGRPDYPQRALAEKQMMGAGGLFSFVPTIQEESWIKRFVESLRLFRLGVSWGGFESLVVTLELDGFAPGESGWIVRLYCGLEEPADLIADLQRAFEAAEY